MMQLPDSAVMHCDVTVIQLTCCMPNSSRYFTWSMAVAGGKVNPMK